MIDARIATWSSQGLFSWGWDDSFFLYHRGLPYILKSTKNAKGKKNCKQEILLENEHHTFTQIDISMGLKLSIGPCDPSVGQIYYYFF